jgi:hypothetical protein
MYYSTHPLSRIQILTSTHRAHHHQSTSMTDTMIDTIDHNEAAVVHA